VPSGAHVYSERLLTAQGTSGWHQWRVPAGRRVIVTDIAVVNSPGLESVCQVALAGVAVADFRFLVKEYSVHLGLRQVIYQGEVAMIYLSDPEMAASMSGYLFADDSGATGPPASAGPLPAAPAEPWPDYLGLAS
jgi:hypothetical protein